MGTTRTNDFLFKPINDEQRAAVQAFSTSDILFLLGPAGSGKTHVAVGLAMQEVLSGRAEKIILTRPVIPAGGEQLGFLPGRVEQKMHPWLLPFHDVLRRLCFKKPDEWLKSYCEIAPMAFLRGRTFERSVALLDEAQNASYEQLKLFLSRIGYRARLILSGDTHQADRSDTGLAQVVRRLTDQPLPGVSLCSLDAQVLPRHPLLSELLRRL